MKKTDACTLVLYKSQINLGRHAPAFTHLKMIPYPCFREAVQKQDHAVDHHNAAEPDGVKLFLRCHTPHDCPSPLRLSAGAIPCSGIEPPRLPRSVRKYLGISILHRDQA